MVKILIGNLTSKIVGFLPDNVQNELDDVLSYRLKDAHYMKIVKEKKWDGVYHLYKRSYGQSFYSGLLSLTEEVLKKNSIEYTRVDERVKPAQNMPDLKFIPSPYYEDRPYQQFTIERALKSTRGILKMATGAGKTVVATRIIAEIKTGPFMFYTLTKDLMTQAHKELSSLLNEPIGKIGGGEFEIKNINVCMVQTAIMAVNLNNKEFKISDYKFDDEDIEWDEDQVDSAERLQALKELIIRTKGFMVDECITGDSIITTEIGEITIKEAFEKKCRYVKTYDGNNIVYKPILNWWDKGIKKTLTIETENGEKITCTKNHLLLTRRGWIRAEDVLKSDKLLCVNVVAGRKLLTQININQGNSFLDINEKEERKENGLLFIKNILKNYLYAYAVAERESNQNIKTLIHLLNLEDANTHIQNISMDMTSNQIGGNIILSQQKKKLKQLLEHVLETLHYYCQIKDPKIIDLLQTMGGSKNHGLSIKQNSWRDMGYQLKTKKILDMENTGHVCIQDACQSLQPYQNRYIKMEGNIQQRKHLTGSETLDLRGGFVTMEALAEKDICDYTLKDIQKEKMEKLQSGLIKMDINAPSGIQKAGDIIGFLSQLKHLLKYLIEYQNLSQNACDINWQNIKSISEDKKYNVYDIEVQDTHCFFANGILVHNCHHTSCKSIKDIIATSVNAYWKYGLSATPFREDGAEIMIQAMFGKKIVDISATYLINNKYLIEPYIIFDPIKNDTKLNSYQAIYKTCISSNESFNIHVADIANHMIANGLSVLVLVQHYPQGEMLKKLIPNTEFLTGKMKGEKREQVLSDLKERKKLCLIATSLADEGLDVPTLDAVLLAGGGASSTRVHQRIGRTLRIDKKSANPRDRSIVVYFEHHGAKYLDKHAKKARRIIKTESAFHIIDSAGPTYVKQEIDEIMGNRSGNTINL